MMPLSVHAISLRDVLVCASAADALPLIYGSPAPPLTSFHIIAVMRPVSCGGRAGDW